MITGKALTKENQDAVHKALGFISTALLVFAFVALIVGMFIIYNTFSIVVAQRMREMALLRAIGASKRQVLASVIGESVVVGILASAVGVIAGIGLSIGLKAVMNAVGFQIPGSGVVLRPSAVIIGLLVGTIVTIISAVVPARQAARVPPIAAMRAVALERPINRFRRLGIGGLILALGIVSLFAGLFGNSGISLVGIGALLMLVGVFVVSPLFAAPTGADDRRPAHAAARHRRQHVARERGAEPAPDRDHRRGGDDRGLARRLHHDLRGVGQRVDRLRDRSAAEDRLHRHAEGRRRARRRRAEPGARARRSRRCRRSRRPRRSGSVRPRSRAATRSSPPPIRQRSASSTTSA